MAHPLRFLLRVRLPNCKPYLDFASVGTQNQRQKRDVPQSSMWAGDQGFFHTTHVTSNLAPPDKMLVMLLRQILSAKLPATPSSTKFDLRNPLFCNILRANPFLAIFYADFFGRYDANSSVLNDLERRPGNFLSRSIHQQPSRTLSEAEG